MDKLRVVVKRVLSYLKLDWDLEDYPLRIRFQEASQDHAQIPAYHTQIINWWAMTGLGATRKEALDNLRVHFDNYKREKALPRIGKSPPIDFASTAQIVSYEDLAVEYYDKILGMNYYNCFISDQSSLHDFSRDYEMLRQRSQLNFIVDIDQVEDAIIVEILALIHNKRIGNWTGSSTNAINK